MERLDTLRKIKVLASEPDIIRLLQWCHNKDKDFQKMKISPAEFPICGGLDHDNDAISSYRGVCSLKRISIGDEILFMPEACLITSDLFPSSLKKHDLSLHEKFVIFLFEHLHKHENDNAGCSELSTYLRTLPKEFSSHHPSYLTNLEQGQLPKWCSEIVSTQMTIVERGFEKSQKLFETTTAANERKISFDEYHWAWYVVYTRTVFFMKREDDGSSTKEMALAPFLDLFNHAPEPNTDVVYQEGKGYSIIARKVIQPMEQIFISYGPHPNYKLWSDYGFIPFQRNPYNCIPVDTEDLSKGNWFHDVLKDGRKMALIKEHEMLKELYFLEAELSPNLELLIAVALWNPTRERFSFNVNKNPEFVKMAREIIVCKRDELANSLESLSRIATSSINLLPPHRLCFHPGHSTLAREAIKLKGAKEVKSSQMIKAMLSYLWPKDEAEIRKRVTVALGLLVGAKVLNVCVPLLFKLGVDSLGHTPDLSDPVTTLSTFTFAVLLGYGLARAGAAGFNELRNAVFAKVAQRSIRKIAANVFTHLHNLDLSFHLSRQTGALSKTIDRGSRGINFVLTAMVFNIFPTIFELGLVSSVLGYKYGSDFAFLAVGCVGSYAAYTLAVTQWRTKFRVDMNRAENESGNLAVDSLLNYETVKYFNNEKFEAERYDRILQNFEGASLKTSTSLATLNFGQNAIFSVALSAIMLMAAKQIAQGNMSIGDLVMVNGLLFQLSVPLGFLGSVYREVRQAMIDMTTMFALLSVQTKIQNKENAPVLPIVYKNASIEFQNVTFGYLDNQPILKDFSLRIEPGKKIAIVGGSGSGKSTLVRLLYRFYEPQQGKVLIGDKCIADVDLDTVRKAIAVVPQDCVLFHDTILHNIHYGNLQASHEDVVEASKLANLHDSILRWKKGYDTQVGERGLKLSGGEKQRVAIARAFLKGTPILIFDEATSSLDSLTEQNILEALKAASQGKTSIWIAHRLSTVLDADEIVVLENGRVADRGTHADLLKRKSPLYHNLWSAQQNSSDAK